MKTDMDCIVYNKGGEQSCLLLFHGYGANSEDLAPLASVIKPGYELSWVFPNGILDVPIGPMYSGKAWFPIDVEALEKAMQAGEFRDFASSRPPQFDVTLDKVLPLVNNLRQEYEQLFIGGFSQGAMLAAGLVLDRSVEADALICLSGTLLNRKLWQENVKKIEKIPVFCSHGQQDPVLPYKGSQQLYELFKAEKFEVTASWFKGGHEIPMTVLQDLSRFLEKLKLED